MSERSRWDVRLVRLGVVMAVAHYIAAVAGRDSPCATTRRPMAETERRAPAAIFRRALDALVEARQKDARPFGELFRDAVKESVSSMLFIGGCIMMFSVLIRSYVMPASSDAWPSAAGILPAAVGSRPRPGAGLIKGAFEITIGAREASLAEALAAPADHGGQRDHRAGAGFPSTPRSRRWSTGPTCAIAAIPIGSVCATVILAAVLTWLLWSPSRPNRRTRPLRRRRPRGIFDALPLALGGQRMAWRARLAASGPASLVSMLSAGVASAYACALLRAELISSGFPCPCRTTPMVLSKASSRSEHALGVLRSLSLQLLGLLAGLFDNALRLVLRPFYDSLSLTIFAAYSSA